METFIKLGKVSHEKGTTTVTRAEVYDAHPAHDGKIQFFLTFTLASSGFDLDFDHVSATPFYTDNYGVKTRTGTSVEPYHLRNALEMVVQHLHDGIYLLETGMLMSDGQFWEEK